MQTVHSAADDAVIQRMTASEYLSAATVADDVRAALAMSIDDPLLGLLRNAERLVLVGSGGSYAALLTAQYLLEQVVRIPVHVFTGKDLLWRRPIWLGPRTPIIFASFSGDTVDVVEALRLAQELSVPTIGITGRPASTLARDCDAAMVYSGASIYEVPIIGALRMTQEISDPGRSVELLEAVAELPALLVTMQSQAASLMQPLARSLADHDHLYLTGAGPLSSLAFKLAPVFMENARVGASYFDASEMRHGSIEFLERHQPALVALLGTDESRETTAMIINFVRDRGGLVAVLDAAELAPTHPLLTPMIINSYTQWLVAFSAELRGIDDLDERVYMGKGLLSKGQWP